MSTAPNDTSQNPQRQAAIESIRERRSFYVALGVFGLVNVMLWVMWFTGDRGDGRIPWPLWATVFWGLAMVTWGVRVFSGDSPDGTPSERAIQREMKRRQG